MSAVEPEADASWEPGDPLYDRSLHPHSLYLFNWRDDPTSDDCACNDAAWWPEARSGYALGPEHDLGDFVAEARAARGLPPHEVVVDPVPALPTVDRQLTAGRGLPLMPWQRWFLGRYLDGAG